MTVAVLTLGVVTAVACSLGAPPRSGEGEAGDRDDRAGPAPAREGIPAADPPEPQLPLGFDADAVTFLRALSPDAADGLEGRAKAGDPRAAYLTALFYGYGVHRAADSKVAVGWLTKAADGGMGEAQYTLGHARLLGKWGLPPDEGAGKIWLREAAFNEIPQAAFELAEWYAKARLTLIPGTNAGEPAADAWYFRAAELGHKPARRKVIDGVLATVLPPADEEAVLEWAIRLATDGYPPAWHVVGLIRSRQGDEAEALRVTKLAADRGYAPAMVRLAMAYIDGKGVPADTKAGGEWLVKAAEAGDAVAQVRLGEALMDGKLGQPRDPRRADVLFEKVAKSNSSEALYLLGRIYRRQENGLQAAVSHLRRSAQSGRPEAQASLIEALGQDPKTREEALQLGQTLYFHGNYAAGVAYAHLLLAYGPTPEHQTRPYHPLYAAALRDVPAGQLGLAKLYLNGTGGVAHDPFEATRWLIALSNHPEARENAPEVWAEAHRLLADCYRKGVGVPKDERTADRLGKLAGTAVTTPSR